MTKKMSMKKSIGTLLFLIISVANFAQTTDSVQIKKTIKLVAVGDIMMGTNFPNDSYLPNENTRLLAPVDSILKSGDVTFGNLEGTLLNEGGDLKHCDDWTKCYAFRQPEYFADQLKDAGFDLLSVANNHMGDFGNTGRKNTLKVLEDRGFTYAGQLLQPWDTLRVDGVLIGFTAFAPNSECLRINDYDTAKEVVKMLDSISDIVVVSFHGGAEGATKTHITRKNEIFYGENRGNVYEFARMVIDNGADVVLGHGPHVTRAIDSYKGKFITYSMGNFCTYHRFNLKGVNGLAPIFELNLDLNGDFIDGKITSIKQTGEGGPQLDANNGAQKQIKMLTNTDLPELKLEIATDGKFKFN